MICLISALTSFLLFGFGLIVAYFAARESYFLDDPYPGYVKIHREQKKYA